MFNQHLISSCHHASVFRFSETKIWCNVHYFINFFILFAFYFSKDACGCWEDDIKECYFSKKAQKLLFAVLTVRKVYYSLCKQNAWSLGVTSTTKVQPRLHSWKTVSQIENDSKEKYGLSCFFLFLVLTETFFRSGGMTENGVQGGDEEASQQVLGKITLLASYILSQECKHRLAPLPVLPFALARSSMLGQSFAPADQQDCSKLGIHAG